MPSDTDDINDFTNFLKDRLKSNERGYLKSTHAKTAAQPIFALSRWVSDDDDEWAERIGIFVLPKGATKEEGVLQLNPKFSSALNVNQLRGKKFTPQDVSMIILNGIVTAWPEMEPKDIVRAFAVLSTFFGLQFYPELLGSFATRKTKTD